MGALEEAHLAACGCDYEEDDEDLLELGGGGGGGGGEAQGDAMEAAVRALLVGLGEDDQREGLRRTPKRVAKAFRDGTRGMPARILIPSPEHVWIRS
jgi:GTP cyclohydrolase I